MCGRLCPITGDDSLIRKLFILWFIARIFTPTAPVWWSVGKGAPWCWCGDTENVVFGKIFKVYLSINKVRSDIYIKIVI